MVNRVHQTRIVTPALGSNTSKFGFAHSHTETPEWSHDSFSRRSDKSKSPPLPRLSLVIKKSVRLSRRTMQMEAEGMEDEGPSSRSDPPHSEALQLRQDISAHSESTVPADDVLVDRKAVDKLTAGLLAHYLPDLQNSKRALQELTQNQLILLDTLDQEVTKFRECNALMDLNSLFTEAKVYHNKLVNIRKEMITIHEKTTKLKKRALKLQQQKQKELLEKEQQREKELERERQLIAKPAKRT